VVDHDHVNDHVNDHVYDHVGRSRSGLVLS
jgi:hypothetical protein